METPKKVWKFYLRLACTSFTPCPECQAKIDEYLTGKINGMYFRDGFRMAEGVLCDVLCSKCKKEFVDTIMKSDRIILGNKEYEPIYELQREIPRKRIL